MKLHSTFIVFCAVMVFFNIQASAQVTIGADIPAKSGSLLDLKMDDNNNQNSTKGLLLSRVALVNQNKLDPCIKDADLQPGDEDAHIGLTVYNITDDSDVGLCPGVHVWNGSKWIRIPEPCAGEDPLDPYLINTPNCYIVSPGGTSEEIPIGKAYLVSESRPELIALNDADKVSVSLIWQDVKGLISDISLVDGDKGKFSKLKVTANNLTGNALVAVHVGSTGDKDQDPVVWSWHIWVTNYNPGNANPTAYGQAVVSGGYVYKHNNFQQDYIFMDRNLGALGNAVADGKNAMGLMYQWGRKDPFTSPDGIQSTTRRVLYNEANQDLIENTNGIMSIQIPTSTEYNLLSSIKFPMNFYWNNSAPFDWYTTDPAKQNANLWGENTKNKSVFDPCPKGWRVPFNSSETTWYEHGYPWAGWTDYSIVNSNAGSVGPDFGTDLGYYPATNRRDFDGYWYVQLNVTNIWTGSTKKFSVDYDVTFNAGGSYTDYTQSAFTDAYGGGRAMAMPVRCVRDIR